MSFGSFFRLVIVTPLAGLCTLLFFLTIAAQLAPRPFIEPPREDGYVAKVRAGDICQSERGYNDDSCYMFVIGPD